MGLYLLNISVDNTDPYPNFIPENLSINDQESIIEIVVEKLLGFDNAIKEYDDNENEDFNIKKHIEIILVHINLPQNKNNKYLIQKKLNYPSYQTHLSTGFFQIEGPPPEV